MSLSREPLASTSLHRRTTVGAAVLFLFFLSGVSGLIDQVVWVRHLSLAFGSTVQSAALVTSIFLGGLGVGSLLAGRWADAQTASDALRAYAIAEVCIGALGLVLAVVLPHVAATGTWGATYVPGPNGWQVVGGITVLIRAIVVALLLGPSALWMGATLTLLVRAVVNVRDAGWWMGWLYGLNTLGAALGAFATDTWLVPSFGMKATLGFASALNFIAAIGAFRLPALGRSGSEAAPSTTKPGPAAMAIFVAGFAAMGMELAWFRFLGGALGPYRAVFSTLLAVMLVGLFAGSVSAGLLVRRFQRPVAWFTAAQVVFAGLSLYGFATFDPENLVRQQQAMAPLLADADQTTARWLLHRLNLVTVAGLVLLPAIAMGASFPLGNAMVQDAASRIGTRAGWLYLATTLGNVAGTLTVGFLWLPGLGIQGTVLALGVLATLAPIPLGRRGLASLVGMPAIFLFATLPSDQLLWATFPANRVENEGVLTIHEGVEQILVITGDPQGPARLWTGGHPMTSTSPHAQRYMRLMAHVPLLMQESPKRVAVICFGVGNTLSAAALHPSVESLHAIDLSVDILSHGTWFEHANHGILRDPRLVVHVNDGRHHLRNHPDTYDLITLEPPPVGHAGVAALYSREFYESAKHRLRPGGIVTQWLPAYQVSEDTVRQLVAAFADVFPNNALLVASGREFVLVGSTGATFSLAEVERRIHSRPAVARDLARVGAPNARELAAMFAGVQTLGDAPPLTDDHPTLEYSQVSHVMETRLPAELFDVSTIEVWCADCREDESLMQMLTLTGTLYGTDAFLRFSNLTRPSRTSSFDWSGEGPDVDIVARSPTLQRMFFAPKVLLERAMEHREQGDDAAAWTALEAASFQAPQDPQIQDVRDAWQRSP